MQATPSTPRECFGALRREDKNRSNMSWTIRLFKYCWMVIEKQYNPFWESTLMLPLTLGLNGPWTHNTTRKFFCVTARSVPPTPPPPGFASGFSSSSLPGSLPLTSSKSVHQMSCQCVCVWGGTPSSSKSVHQMSCQLGGGLPLLVPSLSTRCHVSRGLPPVWSSGPMSIGR